MFAFPNVGLIRTTTTISIPDGWYDSKLWEMKRELWRSERALDKLLTSPREPSFGFVRATQRDHLQRARFRLMQVLVEALEDILPDKTEYVARSQSAVYFSSRGIEEVSKNLDKALKRRGIVVEVFDNPASPQVRVELKDVKREIEKAEELADYLAYKHYRNTRDDEYVPEKPTAEDYKELKKELGRSESYAELIAFQEKFKECAEDYNVEIEMYGGPTNQIF